MPEATPATMQAAVLNAPGGPEALQLETRPVPQATPGQVLIRVRAFGINRSELFTRRGESPDVKLPRILGIEATGTVEAAPGGEFQPGDAVMTCMGGLGRNIDGGYAEFTLVPASQIQKIDGTLADRLGWATLGALPEMLQTAWGSLFTALQLQRSEHLLIRGGTTSVGLAAAAIAKNFGARVSATTRNSASEDLLRSSGVEQVFIDAGTIANDVRARYPDGVDRVLELIGVTSLLDSLQCARPGGSVCMTGIVGNKWSFDSFTPMAAIPSAVNLTVYTGENSNFMQMPLNGLLQQVAEGTLKAAPAKTFRLDQIVEAHQLMDSNKAGGKIVVLP